MHKLLTNEKVSLFLLSSVDCNFIEDFLIELNKESDIKIVKIVKGNSEKIEINYEEILKSENDFNTLKDYIEGELDVRYYDFEYEISEYFYNEIKFEKQAYLFIQDLLSILRSNREIIENLTEFFYPTYNKLQEIVVNNYIQYYSKAIYEIKERYSVIIKYIETTENLLPEKNEISKEDLLKKLFRGDEVKIKIFKKYEQKLQMYNFIDDSLVWLKNAASLVRFYNYLETKKIINSAFETNTKGIEYLNSYFNYDEGKSIHSPYKRKLQNTIKNKNEFDFLDIK